MLFPYVPDKRPTGTLHLVVKQGQLQLRRCYAKDLQQEIVVPAATAAFHHDAGATVGMLLQQRQRESIEPSEVLTHG